MTPIVHPSFAKIRSNIATAMQLVYRNDHFLLANSAHERSITHKLATYIQSLFPEWHVDCEYNRRGLDESKDIIGLNTTYPDIIIHRRNTKDNLLVIEAKSIHSQNHGDSADKDKIKKYIEDSRYGYRYGLWICFYDELAETKMDWFKNQAGVCRQVN